jgi:hypothetical protein
MPRPTIDYLNARREHCAGQGSKTPLKPRNIADNAAAWSSLNHHEQVMLRVDAIFAEFRSWARNLPPIGELETEIPF